MYIPFPKESIIKRTRILSLMFLKQISLIYPCYGYEINSIYIYLMINLKKEIA